MKIHHISAISLSLLALVTSCSKKDDPAAQAPAQQAMPVQVAHPIEKEIVQFSDFTGRLEAVESVDIKPRVSGYIESIHFQEGKRVQKGDLLYVIDSRPFQAIVNQLDAQITQAETALSLADSNLKRSKKLIESRAISQEEADIRESEALQAKADLAAAKAELDAAALNLEFTKVTAPISGIADREYVTVGNLVTGDQTSLTSIVSHDPIDAYYEIDERSFLQGVRRFFDGKSPGRGSEIKIPAYLGLDDEEGFPHEGVINFASNQLNPNTATMMVRARFDNKDEFLTPGLFARIRIPISSEKPAILIPDTAIGADQSIRYVWVVNEDNTTERRSITLGGKHEKFRVVHDGISISDRVILKGIQFIRPGIPVDPQMSEL
ncbi:MAG: efflux RND transporter periplasmic adaptor subunit [Akkermansiaceae bacterium]